MNGEALLIAKGIRANATGEEEESYPSYLETGDKTKREKELARSWRMPSDVIGVAAGSRPIGRAMTRKVWSEALDSIAQLVFISHVKLNGAAIDKISLFKRVNTHSIQCKIRPNLTGCSNHFVSPFYRLSSVYY